jgi:Uma2 family endonuclease
MAAVPITFDVSEEPKRKVWTRREVHALQEIGFFGEHRYELVGGELIDKMGQNPPHSLVVGLVSDALGTLFGATRIRVQSPIEVFVDDRMLNEPEPDIAVTRESRRDYENRHPHGADLILVVEISDTSIRMDRLTKAVLYARAGVPQYWVLDLSRRACIAHRDPVNAAYREVREFTETERITLPCGEIEVRDLLPRPIAGS